MRYDGYVLGDTLAFVRGTWRIERTLVDHRAGRQGRFTGTATALPATSGPDLMYSELGELSFGPHTGPARRVLGYHGLPDGTVAVRFADGRPFFLLDLRAGHCMAVHLCGADRYELSYQVRSAGLLEEHWRVRGPDKDYEARATLTRHPEG